MSFRRSRVASVALAVLVGAISLSGISLGPSASAGAASAANATAAAKAVAWLQTQQQADGGFEVTGFPGFETPDAVLAIAESAQTGATWSAAAAKAAVLAIHTGSGKTAIDALDAWVTSGVNAGEASKLVLLVVTPLGLDPHHFGPSGHDLAAIVHPNGCGSAPNLANLFFLETAFVVFGAQLLCGAPPASVIATIRAAQRADGGWNYLGDNDDVPVATDSDVDTTALAVQALVVGGAAWNDPAITAALRFLDKQRSSTGAFQAFASDDPNATAVASLAITAAGFDPSTSCWRDTVDASAAGTAYPDPDAWVRSQQQANGRIASPNDAFPPINTFATSQSVQGLQRSWLPIVRASGAPNCVPSETTDASGATAPTELVVRFTG